MRRTRRSVALVLLLVLVINNAACDDKIKEAAKASDRIATLIGSLIDLKRELGPIGQTCQMTKVCITKAEELKLTEVLLAVNARTKEFNDFAKGFTKDTPRARVDLAKAFEIVSTAITRLSNEAVFPVKNEEAKKRLLAIVNSINASVQLVNAALKG